MDGPNGSFLLREPIIPTKKVGILLSLYQNMKAFEWWQMIIKINTLNIVKP